MRFIKEPICGRHVNINTFAYYYYYYFYLLRLLPEELNDKIFKYAPLSCHKFIESFEIKTVIDFLQLIQTNILRQTASFEAYSTFQ
jgi:hypothetical protein